MYQVRTPIVRLLTVLLATIAFALSAACSENLDGADGPADAAGADIGPSTHLDAGAEEIRDPDGSIADNASTDIGAIDAGPRPPAQPVWRTFAEMPDRTGNRGSWGAPIAEVIGERRFLMFGGSNAPPGGAVGDLFSFSTAESTWSPYASSPDAPPPRYCHCTVYLPTTYELLIVGGRNDRGPLAAAAWTFNLSTEAWTAIEGPVPDGVIGCASVWMPNIGKAVVYGGGSRTRVNDDTWIYDPTTRTFLGLPLEVRPPPRADAASAYDPGEGGQMLIFGGAISANPAAPRMRNDLWAFDGTAWRELSATGTPPAARRAMAAAFDPTRRVWVLYSGTFETGDFDDLWLFDADSKTWTELPTTGAPGPRGFSAMEYSRDLDAFLLFGGLARPAERSLGDVMILTLW